MKRGKRLFIMLSCCLSGCLEIGAPASEMPAPAREGQEKQYHIPAGKHHAAFRYESLEVAELSFEASFDSSAIYQTKDPQNQGDINKLMGMADCGTHHHTNSARFGWRWYEGQLEIWAYTYANAKRSIRRLGVISLGVYYNFSIAMAEDAYVFRLEDQEVRMPRACSGLGMGYKLYPYFGGDEPAPQPISIRVRDGG